MYLLAEIGVTFFLHAWLKVQAVYVREVEAYPSVINSRDAGTGFSAVPQGHRGNYCHCMSCADIVGLLPVCGTATINLPVLEVAAHHRLVCSGNRATCCCCMLMNHMGVGSGWAGFGSEKALNKEA